MNISISLKDFLFKTVLDSKEFMYFSERHKPRIQRRFKQLLMNGYIDSTKEQIVKSVCRILKTLYNKKKKKEEMKEKEKQIKEKEEEMQKKVIINVLDPKRRKRKAERRIQEKG